jgi:hypothetical protein
MNGSSARTAYDHRQRQVLALVGKLQGLLVTHRDEAASDLLNWGYVGDLGRVIELLCETVSALGGQMTVQSPPVKTGSRVRMIHMPSDPDPIKPGATGTVVVATGGDFPQLQVAWDDGRSLALLEVDDFEVLD